MSTHKDWEKAQEKRNWAALDAARLLTRGDTEGAKKAAEKAVAHDDEMHRITAELDGNGTEVTP
ncbi:hypothetical protein [Arthrobacter sp. ISL-69]|uniref:hypothetical protein n=1 Tax=Arthrobacter sp. ISL-69 TaxID=2819113 RepID=UPI001BE90756|nr:hypothetical protein [Arthrobacter sp. ISL-69]MBT2538776.1 hypothetical protein [Arthrobacter sp. ISL-69]